MARCLLDVQPLCGCQFYGWKDFGTPTVNYQHGENREHRRTWDVYRNMGVCELGHYVEIERWVIEVAGRCKASRDA